MGLTTDRNDDCIKLIRSDGMQECYLILPEEERSKGFVRPYRESYKHEKCGVVTRKWNFTWEPADGSYVGE